VHKIEKGNEKKKVGRRGGERDGTVKDVDNTFSNNTAVWQIQPISIILLRYFRFR
jgi:hypothetical protein